MCNEFVKIQGVVNINNTIKVVRLTEVVDSFGEYVIQLMYNR